MLLIGSRALRYHFPQFREPVDWDLVGTREEAARLEALLPLAPRASQRLAKVHFKYGDALVEVAIAEHQPYWAHVADCFANGPRVNDPVLGELTIPPAAFLMMTKQCGLIYRIAHWHKNLEDLYYLRNLIPEIPVDVAALLPLAQADSRRMFAARHNQVAREPWACHPRLPPHARPDLHELLHQTFKLSATPLRERTGAWQAFPQSGVDERVPLMAQLLAEEAMVLAGHQVLATPQESSLRSSSELKRYALRCLIVSGLPEGWRYFGVNHYRQIAELIPEDFADRLEPLWVHRPSVPHACIQQELPEIEPLLG